MVSCWVGRRAGVRVDIPSGALAIWFVRDHLGLFFGAPRGRQVYKSRCSQC